MPPALHMAGQEDGAGQDVQQPASVGEQQPGAAARPPVKRYRRAELDEDEEAKALLAEDGEDE